MACTIPPDYTELAAVSKETRKDRFFHVIGVVTDCLPPRETRGSDWQMTFKLQDPSMSGDNPDVGVRVKFFAPRHRLPQLKKPGDVVMLRQVKSSLFADEMILISNLKTQFFVFPSTTLPARSSGDGMPYLTLDEFDRNPPREDEKRWAAAVSRNSRKEPSTGLATQHVQRNDKFSHISHVGDNMFCDLIVEVVKKYNQSSSEFLELYVTDYTRNANLIDRRPDVSNIGSVGSSTSWQGPAGKITLKLEVHPPHMQWIIQNANVGDLLFLQNVRIKQNRDGRDLEGNMWHDREYPGKVCAMKAFEEDPKTKDLIARRAEYQRRHGGNWQSGRNDPANPQKRPKKNKPHKKKRKQEQARAQEHQIENRFFGAVEEAVQGREMSLESGLGDGSRTDKASSNSYVSTPFNHIALSTLEQAVQNPSRWWQTGSVGPQRQLPFVNARHRLLVQVADYFPHSLEDFSVPLNEERTLWKWDFWLIVTEAEAEGRRGVQVQIQCIGEDAQELLGLIAGDVQATGSGEDKRRLEKKLFTLWGDLHEQKERYLEAWPRRRRDPGFSAVAEGIRAKNKPFECCIEEVGIEVELDGEESTYARLFRMFGTRIE